jgi:iron complex outermembrane receptor protein
MYGNRVNIKVDGMSWKEVGPNSMDPPLSHIPAALTESLEVTRGISPVSSGIEAVGGSMKVNLRKGNFAEEEGEVEWDGVASTGYSTVDDGHFGAIFTSVANKNHKLFASGSREIGNSYSFENDKAVKATEYDRDAYTVGYGYQRDGHEFSAGYSNNDTGHTGTPTLPLDIDYVRGGINTFDYKGEFDAFSVDTSFYIQNMRHAMNNFKLRTPPPTMAGGLMFRQAFTEVDGLGGKLAFTVPLLDGDFTLGFEGDTSNHDAVIKDPSNGIFRVDAYSGVERDRYSVFGEWSGDIFDKTSLEVGARYSYITSNAGNVIGRNPGFMGTPSAPAAMALNAAFNSSERRVKDENIDLAMVLRHEATENIDVEVGFARKTRSPSYQELYTWIPLETTGGLADGRNYIGDLTLNHEVAYQAELGFEWHSDDLYIAPRFFYHHVEDYIQGTATTNANALIIDPNALQFTNVDAQLYGFDVEGSYSITDELLFDTVVSYVRGKRTDKNDNLYRIAPLNARTQLTYQQSFWSAAVEGEFYASQNDVSAFNGELKTPGYALLNLRGQIQPVHGFTIGLGIENVFDKSHEDHLAGINRVRGNQDLAVGARIRAPGRNYYATLSYDW